MKSLKTGRCTLRFFFFTTLFAAGCGGGTPDETAKGAQAGGAGPKREVFISECIAAADVHHEWHFGLVERGRERDARRSRGIRGPGRNRRPDSESSQQIQKIEDV